MKWTTLEMLLVLTCSEKFYAIMLFISDVYHAKVCINNESNNIMWGDCSITQISQDSEDRIRWAKYILAD